MKLKDAVNASQIHAARGFDERGACVVSVSFYGDKLLWLPGFGGEWAKDWKSIPDEEMAKLDDLDFRPTGPKPEDQLGQEVLDALTEIHKDCDEFEPIGERDE